MSGNETMKKDIADFIAFAKEHTDKTFFVTPIGCGIAGKQPSEVAPMFKECAQMENVCLPASFWDVIGLPMTQQKTTISNASLMHTTSPTIKPFGS